MAAVESSMSKPPTFEVVYERVWESGERTEHSLSVECFTAWAAETAYHWRVERPKEVQSQRILWVHDAH